MYFLALSQAPPLEVIEMPMNKPVTMLPTRTPPSIFMPSGIDATRTTATTGQQRGHDHLLQRGFGHDVYASAVFRCVLALEDSRMPFELAADLGDDGTCRAADSVHAECRKEIR